MSERAALIGLSGAGKTTVAPHVAARLRCGWRDLDDAIAEAAGRPVSALIRAEGEAAFRARESAALRALLEDDPRPRLVVSCGAGVLLAEENRRLIRARALAVWLRVTPEAAAARLGAEPGRERPLLAPRPDPHGAGSGGRDRAAERLRDLLAERRAGYGAAARAVVETDGRTPEDVAAAVAARLVELGWA